jgi:hypothetical protein
MPDFIPITDSLTENDCLYYLGRRDIKDMVPPRSSEELLCSCYQAHIARQPYKLVY